MSHQYQYVSCRDLNISIPQNNMEVVCPSIFRKGICNTAAKEVDENIPLSDNMLCHT